MASRKISRSDLLSSCAEPAGDDGHDPRRVRRVGSSKVPNRKARQLCAQVARALASALADCGDDMLRELVIESVVPAPNTSRLMVTVYSTGPVETDRLLARLQGARGKLRGEATAAIHRRRAPDLVFRVGKGGGECSLIAAC